MSWLVAGLAKPPCLESSVDCEGESQRLRPEELVAGRGQHVLTDRADLSSCCSRTWALTLIAAFTVAPWALCGLRRSASEPDLPLAFSPFADPWSAAPWRSAGVPADDPAADPLASEQVRVAFTEDPRQFVVSWVSTATPAGRGNAPFRLPGRGESEVQAGVDPAHLSVAASAPPRLHRRAALARYLHDVTVRSPCVGCRVFYRVRVSGDPSPWSRVFWVDIPSEGRRFPDPLSGGGSVRALIAADVGFRCAARPAIAAQIGSFADTVGGPAGRHRADFVFVNGDAAYNIDARDGRVADDFFAKMQELGGSWGVPHLYGVGDHEREWDVSYATYQARMHVPLSRLARASRSASLLHYSFDWGPVHFVSVFTDPWVRPPLFGHKAAVWAWLRQDLAAVDRARTPWVVVMGHQSLYCHGVAGEECGAQARALRHGTLPGGRPLHCLASAVCALLVMAAWAALPCTGVGVGRGSAAAEATGKAPVSSPSVPTAGSRTTALAARRPDAMCRTTALAMVLSVLLLALAAVPWTGSWLWWSLSGAPFWEPNLGLEPLLLEHAVDLYLSGHTHHYERSWPVRDGRVARSSYADVDAPVHVVGGFGGCAGFDDFVGPRPPWNAFRQEAALESFGVLEARNATALTYTQRGADGSEVDRFVITKRSGRWAASG